MKAMELLESIRELNEENQTMFKRVTIVRVGGLSSTPHDNHVKNRKDYYHTPPSKDGLFVFLDGKIDRTLYAWKYKNQTGLKMKKFPYRGKIWTHMKVDIEDVKYYRSKGSWYETDSNSIQKIFAHYKPVKPKGKTYGDNPHYELFIDKKHIGGI